ncbi:hypothetical protein [Streptomyces sp. NPDC101206]|uniref:hypothetical protein n=1 Tax=Streptomyces sp. NPDC101206 TaxID=3366128 RepID=UPI00382DDBC0
MSRHDVRSTAALVLLDTLTQTAPAGLFVTADLDLPAWHSANADVLTASCATSSSSTAHPGPSWRSRAAAIASVY